MATSSAQSGFVDNWMRGKSVIECNLHMLETEDFTDVTFLVGSEKHVVRAHRYVLASRSCVFHAMFCGPMAEQREIIIPDIEVNVFKDFLRFLYTDACTINSDNVAGLLYTSRKYDVETLFTQSAAFLENSLCEENLCEILEKSHGYGETDLEKKALNMLSSAGPKVIKSSGFLELCSGCFGSLLKSRNLNLKEETVFEAAMSWTKKECEREGLSPSHENMRRILGEMLYEIRFASLSLDFMVGVVGPSGILKDQERLKILERIIDTSHDISPFKSDPRNNTLAAEEKTSSGFYSVKRFSTDKQPSKQGRYHEISFSANKPITLRGLLMYGSDSEETTTLEIHLFDDQMVRICDTGRITVSTSGNVISNVMLTHPVSIQAGRVYTIYVNFHTDKTRYSGTGGLLSKVSAGGVEFKFIRTLNTTCHISHSSIEEGQIPGLIWK